MKLVRLTMLLIVAISMMGCVGTAHMSKGETAPVQQPSSDQTATTTPGQAAVQKETAQPAPTKPIQASSFTLLAVGDIMMHQEQLEAAWDAKKKDYDLSIFFTKVAPILKQGDIVIGNLETTMAGSKSRYTGYPMFNAPESLAKVLKQVGFTAVTTANNHSLDRREHGVLSTISFLDQAGLKHTGTFRSAQDRDQPLFLEKNGIKLAVLSYAYGTNGIKMPEGKPYLVNLIQPALIKQDIARAKAQGADLVMVALHFGQEYQRMPNETQKQTADLCIQAGADLIIGHHPHVVQPYEWRTVTMPDGSKRTRFVAYSLGNFVSAQRWDYKDVGTILKLTITKQTDGTTVVQSPSFIPTYVHFWRHSGGKRHYLIYPMQMTLEAKQTDPWLGPKAKQEMKRLYAGITAHLESIQKKQK